MLLDLFLTFAKIGAFTFGGGYAMIAIIEEECVEKKKWITAEELTTVTVLAESTPGPIAINCATYTGYMKGGLAGAVAATVGMVLPSFLIIYVISLFFDNFLEIAVVAKAFKGIKIAVGLLITRVAWNMWIKSKKTKQSCIIAGLAVAVMLVSEICAVKVSTIIWILAAGIGSIFAHMMKHFIDKGGAAA